jgi:hypothetical protein
MPKVYKKNILIKYLHCKMLTWQIWMLSFQSVISYDFSGESDESDVSIWRHSLTVGIQKAFRHLPQTVWTGLDCGPSIPYPFRGMVFGEERTHTKIPLSTKIQDVVFCVHRLNGKICFMHAACLRLYGSGGGGLYLTVRTLWGSGVCIKILYSGFRNPNPDLFALLLLWFAGPDHVWIQIYTQFAFWSFLRVRIRGSGPGFASYSAALENSLQQFLIFKDSRHFSCEFGLFHDFCTF